LGDFYRPNAHGSAAGAELESAAAGLSTPYATPKKKEMSRRQVAHFFFCIS
jgi:hypothetical protein